MSVVLDASALLAVLLDEPGSDLVLEALSGAHISIVNLAEVFAKTVDQGGIVEETQQRTDRMRLRVRAFRDADAVTAALLRLPTKHLGLGFGDRACLALAQLNQLPVLTADQAWAKLDLGIDIRLIR